MIIMSYLVNTTCTKCGNEFEQLSFLSLQSCPKCDSDYNHHKFQEEEKSELPTVQEQAETFGATDWKYKGDYVHFYNGHTFVGASNMNYLKAKSNG